VKKASSMVVSKNAIFFLLVLAATGAVSLYLLDLTAFTTEMPALLSMTFSEPRRLAPPPSCVEPLRPGEKGAHWFHSQSHETTRQDSFVFKMLGGEIDEESCTGSKFCFVSDFSQEIRKCNCRARTSPGAFGRTFLEIGATDGLYLSNMAFFEYQMGWSGVCVEASPIVFQKLHQNRPNCKSFNAVVGKAFKGKSSTFLSFMKYGSWEIGMSGMLGSKRHLKSIENAKKYAEDVNATLQVDQVPGVLLSNLYEEAGMKQIDWASIDVEGHEASVLETWDIEKVPIALLNSKNSGITDVIKGWELKQIPGPSIDVWYLNKKVAQASGLPIGRESGMAPNGSVISASAPVHSDYILTEKDQVFIV
jgi:FkbM family methyltransferase